MLVVISSAILAGIAASAFAQTNSTSTATSTAPSSTDASSISVGGNVTDVPPWGMGMMMGDQGFGGGGPGGFGGREGGFGGLTGDIQISSAFNQTVNKILGNDTDVQKLVSQGYNVTSIRPMLSSTIGADGTVTTTASTATVMMQNGTSGYATVSLDVANAKVTQIIIVTRTVIDKSTS